MCASNHSLATTTQFSFRRTRFQADDQYTCSCCSSFPLFYSIPSFTFRISIESSQFFETPSLSLSLPVFFFIACYASSPTFAYCLRKSRNQRFLRSLRSLRIYDACPIADKLTALSQLSAQLSRLARRASSLRTTEPKLTQPICEFVICASFSRSEIFQNSETRK